MRYDEYRVFVVRQVVFEPHDRIDVQVVRRLVEQQVIRFAEQGLRQQHAYFLFGIEVPHQLVMQVFLDSQSAEQVGCVAFGIPTVHFGEFFLEFPDLDTVFVREVRFCIQGVLFVHNCPQWLMAHQHCIQNGMFVKFEVVLFEDGKSFRRTETDRTARRGYVAAEDFEKGGLAGAVRTDDPVAVAGCEFQVYIFEQHAFAVLHFEI